MRLEHWQNAQNQGVAAARSMLDRGEAFAEVPWFWSDQYDVNLQMAGHPGHLDQAVVRGDKADLSFCALYVREAASPGAVAVNRPRAGMAMKLIETGHHIDLEALADESIDLRKLARG